MPNISVVVPVYKVEPYLKRCVDSILNQTYSDFQIILVDDGSPDNCGEICDEYAKKDARIHVIHRENGGLSAARNSGINWVFDHSFTEWITFIDSDDWVCNNYLKLLLDLNIQNNTDISICNSTFAYDDNTSPNITNVYRCISPESFWVKNQGNAVVAWGKLYKTSLFERLRYPEGKLHEDEYITYKFLFLQKEISVTSDGLYFYYQSPNSIMRSKWSAKRLDNLEAYGEQLVFFNKNGYKKAYNESKKLFTISIINNINEIKKSKNKDMNMSLLVKKIQSYLFKRYNSKLLSTLVCCRLYIQKLKIERFFSVRINALYRKIKISNN